jgi:hypothetical protein
MPKATTCKLDGQLVEIEESLRLRDEAARRREPYPEFRCRECAELVRPHKEGTTGQAAHFEHRRRSSGCRLGT